MTKITERNESSSLLTVDKSLIEQAIAELLPDHLRVSNFALRQKLRAALAEPAVEPTQWYLSSDGLPPVGAQVIGGHFYVDSWLKDETPVFSWGLCRVLETEHPDFKDGKQWHTFGPSHNQITHWCRPPAPPCNGNTSPPPPAEAPLLSDFEISDIFQKSNKPGSSHGDFDRVIERAVRQKAGL